MLLVVFRLPLRPVGRGSLVPRCRALVARPGMSQLQPLVPPQVLHFMQVPLRTSV